MIRRIKCWLGFHDWEVSGVVLLSECRWCGAPLGHGL